jgi:hypothetical protein
LYLEFLENKSKVLKEKRNVGYEDQGISIDYLDYQAQVQNTFDDSNHFYEDTNTEDVVYETESVGGDRVSPEKRSLEDLDDGEDENSHESVKRIKTSPQPGTPNYNERLYNLENNIAASYSTQHRPQSIEEIKAKTISLENQQNEKKRELLAKFNMLKKQYPNSIAATYALTLHTDLVYMQNLYDETIQQLQIDKKHDSYRNYLMMGFYGVEMILGKFFKLDMEGFTTAQIANMDKYDVLLIELGHKHYIPNAPEKFPVEVRLLGLIIINTLVFLLMKKVSGAMSGEMALGGLLKMFNLSNSFSNSSSSEKVVSGSETRPPTSTPKMKGPSNQ